MSISFNFCRIPSCDMLEDRSGLDKATDTRVAAKLNMVAEIWVFEYLVLSL